MKKCSKCGIEKPLEEFFLKTGNRRHSYCKECKKEYDRKWYINNENRRTNLNISQNKRRIRNQDFVRDYKKSRSCEICGYNKTHHALEFHHISGDKKYSISTIRTLSLETIKAEIAKCILICANCHRELHHLEL